MKRQPSIYDSLERYFSKISTKILNFSPTVQILHELMARESLIFHFRNFGVVVTMMTRFLLVSVWKRLAKTRHLLELKLISSNFVGLITRTSYFWKTVSELDFGSRESLSKKCCSESSSSSNGTASSHPLFLICTVSIRGWVFKENILTSDDLV